MVNVLVVSDIRIYREGLRDVLARSGQISVIGVAESLAATLAFLARSRPDVVLLDMGTAEARTLTQTIAGSFSQVKVVAFGLSECKKAIIEYAEAGISGYVSKNGSANDVVRAVLRAVEGELECSATVAGALLERLNILARVKKARYSWNALTTREMQVAELVGKGLTNNEIATQLKIRVATTKTHVHHVLGKLGARRRGQVATHLGARERDGLNSS